MSRKAGQIGIELTRDEVGDLVSWIDRWIASGPPPPTLLDDTGVTGDHIDDVRSLLAVRAGISPKGAGPRRKVASSVYNLDRAALARLVQVSERENLSAAVWHGLIGSQNLPALRAASVRAKIRNRLAKRRGAPTLTEDD